MWQQLAVVLGQDAGSIAMRCAHIDNAWTFARYDGVALMNGDGGRSPQGLGAHARAAPRYD